MNSPVTLRMIIFGHVTIVALLASVFLISNHHLRALIGIPLWSIGLPVLLGLPVASVISFSDQLSTGIWVRLALDIALLLLIVPIAMAVPGTCVFVLTANAVAIFTTENITVLFYLMVPIGWVFTPPFLPYVWPVFVGRARRNLAVDRPLAAPPSIVIGGALFMSAIILLLPGHSLIARVGFIIPWVIAALVYPLTFKSLPRFAFPVSNR